MCAAVMLVVAVIGVGIDLLTTATRGVWITGPAAAAASVVLFVGNLCRSQTPANPAD